MSSLFDTATPHPAGYREVEVRPLFEAPRDDLALVDVREPAELAGLLGHIDGVHRAPLSTVAEAVRDWPRQAPVVLVCRSGARSARAAAQLVGLGFTRVMNLRGGMLAWNTARLPVVSTHPAPLPSVEAVRDALFQGLHQLLVHTEMPGDASTAVGERAAHEGSARRDDSVRTARPADSGAAPAHRAPSSASPTVAHLGASDATPAQRVPALSAPPSREAAGAREHRNASSAAPADAPATANHPPQPPSRLALAAVLDALQAARPPDIRDAAAFDVLLRDLKDQLAVAQARPEGLT
ncbi:rhodanese-like domain-containing protein [Comamonas sp. JC664]|uniref:rhodanese-like domain-containing protein n=1 Tax=Comamonas sp. JC664 TaxID=2801917 RepID=UPI00191CCECC|nr:rhodanese-like domain-containing protein [Comamonas sp. JC664]MBL0698313.1 rhodanese-like domain-containing protein [Comamonas sp. JC664]GHG89528.1 hypothetical protein GCM10012319_49020 [Comamonas sp. KCTC 72670]